jgi:hypothetical protein
MRKYFGDVVQELTEFGVIGRVPAVESPLNFRIANDFRWYAAHRLSATRRLSLHHRSRRHNGLTPIMSAVNWHYIHITLIYVKRYVRIKGETPIICQRPRHMPNSYDGQA